MGRWRMVAGIGVLVAAMVVPSGPRAASAAPMAQAAQSGGALDPAYLDKLLAPVALYPDQLLAQMLLCSGNARKVGELSAWLKKSEAQGQRAAAGRREGGLRAQLRGAGSLPAGGRSHGRQPDLDLAARRGLRRRSRGGVRQHPAPAEAEPGRRQPEEHAPADRGDAGPSRAASRSIVIEPANPQVVYVPQYNPQVVYVQQPTTTTVVVHEDNDDEAAAGAVIGFTAGRRRSGRPSATTTTTGRTAGAAAPTCTTTAGTTGTTTARTRARTITRIARTRARTMRTTARTWPASAPIARRTRGSSALSARTTRGSSAESVPRARRSSAASARRRAAPPRRRPSATSGARRRRAGRRKRGARARARREPAVALHDRGRAQRRTHAVQRRTERHALGRLLRLLERQLDPVQQLARARQPPSAAAAAGAAGDEPAGRSVDAGRA